MRIITVSAAQSGLGKTTVAEELLKRLNGWSAVKVTVVKDKVCPRSINCGVCGSLTKGYDIITEARIINQKDTDTARLKKAGAKKVVWLRARLDNLEKGLKKALLKLQDGKGILIEGTSVLRYIKPDLAIYLKDSRRNLKSSAQLAQRKADIIIDVNG